MSLTGSDPEADQSGSEGSLPETEVQEEIAEQQDGEEEEKESDEEEEEEKMRHGFSQAYTSDEYLNALESTYFMYWTDPRHDRSGLPHPPDSPLNATILWRSRARIRTTSAILLPCLRIGFDPPDSFRSDPSARMECWVDIHSSVLGGGGKEKVMERVSANLRMQFESLASSPKVKYRVVPDPPVEDAKKYSLAVRRLAKNDRVLFYYNGHGVPKPTSSGELWMFNRLYTQYIPVSLAEIIEWVGSPAIMVWECSGAGNIVSKVSEFGARKDAELARDLRAWEEGGRQGEKPVIPIQPYAEIMQLGACLGNQTLPTNPDLPADLFTSCLTSPIEMAVRFFMMTNPLYKHSGIALDTLLDLPGRLNDRRTPLGELMWIFTAVTDTIAWNVLPAETFQKLFRHDLVVAALFRGFLLAERIMRYFECEPVSVPPLPKTHDHELWESWDLAVDMCIKQLPKMLTFIKEWSVQIPANVRPPSPVGSVPGSRTRVAAPSMTLPPNAPPLPYIHSSFFADQLTAFNFWLESGIDTSTEPRPTQLPIVLQVLLSQAHRLRALVLLCKFLDLGPWAVNVALGIGIFAYVLRLLQAPAMELKPVLIYIWTRILAVYEGCKEDLIRPYPGSGATGIRSPDQAPYMYFASVLLGPTHIAAQNGQPSLPIPNISEHRAMCAFILSLTARSYSPGRLALLQSGTFHACVAHLGDPDPLLRQWSAFCVGMCWDECVEGVEEGLAGGWAAGEHTGSVWEIMLSLLKSDTVPEVRAAVLFSLSMLVGVTGSSVVTKRSGRSITSYTSVASPAYLIDIELNIAFAALKSNMDGSPLVRRELVVLLSAIVANHWGAFQGVAFFELVARASRLSPALKPDETMNELIEQLATLPISSEESSTFSTCPAAQNALFVTIYKTLLCLSGDPFPDIAILATGAIDSILTSLLSGALGRFVRILVNRFPAVRDVKPTRTVELEDGDEKSHARRVGSVAGVVMNFASSLLGHEDLTSATTSTSTSSFVESNGLKSRPGPRPRPKSVYESHQSYPSHSSHTEYSGLTEREVLTPNEKAECIRIIHGFVNEDHERIMKPREDESKPNHPIHPNQPGQNAEGGSGIREQRIERGIPLKSVLYDWAVEYYKDSQMKIAEPDDAGSLAYTKRHWRRAKNDTIITHTQGLGEVAVSKSWDTPYRIINTKKPVSKIALHQFESHVVVSDSTGWLGVYDWENGKMLNRFKNSANNVPISSLKFVNEDDVGMILCASADGLIRIYRSYWDAKTTELVSSFQGLDERLSTDIKRDSGVVCEWLQGRGELLIGGNVRFLRVWDAGREAIVQDLPTRSNSPLTSVTCDQLAGNIIVAGFGDGSLKVYDRRLPPLENMVKNYKGIHKEWVLGVKMQRGGMRELVSASVEGNVGIWDIREENAIGFVYAGGGATSGGELSGFALHEHAPVFSTVTKNNIIQVWDVNRTAEPISRFKHSPQLIYNRPKSILDFHPHHLMLACGSRNGIVALYENEKYYEKEYKHMEAMLARPAVGRHTVE